MDEFNPIDLIEKYIDTIDQNRFDDLYDALESEIPSHKKSIVGEVTRTLENAGINPLDHLDHVPNYYNAYREDLQGEIYLPSTIKFIGSAAFSFCQNITRINLPDTCTHIYAAAFAGCTELKSISFPVDLKFIGIRAFYNCRNLNATKISFPESLEEIGNFAFYGCRNLKEVTMPLNLKKLGQDPFSKCDKDLTVKLHKGAQLFQAYANLHFEYID